MTDGLRDLQERFRSVLVAAQHERGDREDWIAHEHRVALGLLNDVRARHGFAPLTMGDVWTIESPATGHIDYTSKFSLYLAEAAVTETPPSLRNDPRWSG